MLTAVLHKGRAAGDLGPRDAVARIAIRVLWNVVEENPDETQVREPVRPQSPGCSFILTSVFTSHLVRGN